MNGLQDNIFHTIVPPEKSNKINKEVDVNFTETQ